MDKICILVVLEKNVVRRRNFKTKKKEKNLTKTRRWYMAPFKAFLKFGFKENECLLAIQMSLENHLFRSSALVFFFVFLPFLGPFLQHMEVPRLGV